VQYLSVQLPFTYKNSDFKVILQVNGNWTLRSCTTIRTETPLDVNVCSFEPPDDGFCINRNICRGLLKYNKVVKWSAFRRCFINSELPYGYVFPEPTEPQNTTVSIWWSAKFSEVNKGNWIDLGHQVAEATKFCTVAPNICGSSARNLLHVTLLTPRILRWLLEF
jgi:hypothetical protein